MDYYLYKRYSPFLEGRQVRVLDSFNFITESPSDHKADPFSYTAKKFISELDKKIYKGTLDDLIDLKLHIAKARTELILDQLEQIKKQKQYNLKGITYDSLKVGNLILYLSPQIYKDYRKLFEIYRRKLDLYREARTEESRFLRNTIRLGEELRESLLDLKKETEKREFLSSLEEEVNVHPLEKYTGDLNY